MYETSAIRKGLKIEIDGEPYAVVDFQFVKPGKGNAFTRCKIKHLISGAVLDRTWRSGERLQPAALSERTMLFLYRDEEGFHLMDQQNYEQISMPAQRLQEEAPFLKENLEVQVLFFREEAISLSLPNFVDLTVTHTDPGVRGDTVSGARKPATLETGTVIQVPLFIEVGEVLRIDTRDGQYVERSKK